MQAATQQNAPTQSATRLRGFIKNVQVTRGFCFVRGDDHEEFFLHEKDLEGSSKAMVKGALVEFTPIAPNVPGKSRRATMAVVLSRPVKNQ